MNDIPSVSSQINEAVINKIIDKNFSKLAPTYYSIMNNWLIQAYRVFHNIDKFIILIYLVDKDFIFFRKNGIIVDFDTFFNSSKLEIEKVNISDISKDLNIPKESARRKVEELQKKGVIKKIGKKVFLDRNLIKSVQPADTLNAVSVLLNLFNKILVKEKITKVYFETDEIAESMKANFSFAAYQFNKFLFGFTNRWRKELKDLETFCIGQVVLLNSVEVKDFRIKDLNRKLHNDKMRGADKIGVNAMSISEITGIPRPTVVRKLNYLIQNDYLKINDKKLITVAMNSRILKKSQKLQDENIIDLSKFIYRVFNQIKVIDSNKEKDDDFIPSYLR
tara:strand:- start:1042 stop:2046 length:1005 start_codon:yes stop_codon:yes gene_type:complete